MKKLHLFIILFILAAFLKGNAQSSPTFSVMGAKKSQDSLIGITQCKLALSIKLTNVSSIKSIQYYILNQADSVIHVFNRIDLMQHANGFYYFMDSNNKRFTLFNDELNIAEIINSSYFNNIKKVKVEMKDVGNNLTTSNTVVSQ